MDVFKQKNCYNKMTSVRKITFQILLKNRKLLSVETFGNILAFDKKSKRKLLSLISADSFIKNNLIYDFRV